MCFVTEYEILCPELPVLAHLPAGSYFAKTEVPCLEGQRTFQIQLIRP